MLGILSFLFWWVPFLGLAGGIVSIVLASLGIRDTNREPTRVGGKGMAIAGLVLGILAAAFGLFILVLFAAIGSSLRRF